jgi:hypothetical protein
VIDKLPWTFGPNINKSTNNLTGSKVASVGTIDNEERVGNSMSFVFGASGFHKKRAQ